MSQNATLFVALSTGQNIANLLPILELFEPGDRVLWIESATAQRLGWSIGPCEVLRRHGIDEVEIARLADDDPGSCYRLLSESDSVRAAGAVRLVSNGGTKPQMLAAFQALSGRLTELLYNHDRQCVLERYPHPPQGTVSRVPYGRHRIDLMDVLACNRMEIVPGKEECVWPGEPPALPDYGKDPFYTKDRHARIWQWVHDRPPRPEKAFTYEKASQLAPEQKQRLRNNILEGCGLPADTTIKSEKGMLARVYNSAHKLDLEAWEQQAKRVSTEEAPNVGREFEDAVAARLLVWLAKQPLFSQIVQSVWRNVSVRRQGSREDAAELDIALLLKNGLLLHFECKSFDAALKDMDARLAVLQRSASQLARIAICIPSYSGLDNAPWCNELSQNVKKISGWKQFEKIEFTLPGQPGTSFEDSIEAWLRRWLPPDE